MHNPCHMVTPPLVCANVHIMSSAQSESRQHDSDDMASTLVALGRTVMSKTRTLPHRSQRVYSIWGPEHLAELLADFDRLDSLPSKSSCSCMQARRPNHSQYLQSLAKLAREARGIKGREARVAVGNHYQVRQAFHI